MTTPASRAGTGEERRVSDEQLAQIAADGGMWSDHNMVSLDVPGMARELQQRRAADPERDALRAVAEAVRDLFAASPHLEARGCVSGKPRGLHMHVADALRAYDKLRATPPAAGHDDIKAGAGAASVVPAANDAPGTAPAPAASPSPPEGARTGDVLEVIKSWPYSDEAASIPTWMWRYIQSALAAQRQQHERQVARLVEDEAAAHRQWAKDLAAVAAERDEAQREAAAAARERDMLAAALAAQREQREQHEREVAEWQHAARTWKADLESVRRQRDDWKASSRTACDEVNRLQAAARARRGEGELSLRDYCAVHAATEELALPETIRECAAALGLKDDEYVAARDWPRVVARARYIHADAMLAARKEGARPA